VIAIETLREEVRRLPLEEREEFAAFVLDTLPPPDEGVSDEEVARRLEEMRSGADPGFTTEELFAEIHRQLR
jgi:hypothetical protein